MLSRVCASASCWRQGVPELDQAFRPLLAALEAGLAECHQADLEVGLLRVLTFFLVYSFDSVLETAYYAVRFRDENRTVCRLVLVV